MALAGQTRQTGKQENEQKGQRRAECGVIARDVAAIAIEGLRRQHEADAHPEIYLRRKKLALAIPDLNRRWWRKH